VFVSSVVLITNSNNENKEAGVINMAAVLEAKIADLQEAAAKQGDVVRSLKASAKDGKADKASGDGCWEGGGRHLAKARSPAQSSTDSSLLSLCNHRRT